MTTAPKFDLTERVALVTGASSGLGAGYGRILAASGAKVVLAARRTDRLQSVCAEIVEAGGWAVSVAMDVADEASTIAAYDDAAEAAFGTVDTIVANAGMNSEGPTTELAIAEFDQTVAVNPRGVFLTVREGATPDRRRIEGHPARTRGHHRLDHRRHHLAGRGGLQRHQGRRGADGKGHGARLGAAGDQCEHDLPGLHKDRDQRRLVRHRRRRQADRQVPTPTAAGDSDLDVALLWLCSDAARAVAGTSITVDDGQSL